MLQIPTLSEIMAVSQARGQLSEAPKLWDGLMGWWPNQERGGRTVFDVTGRGNHGTLTNMAPSSDWVFGQENGWGVDLDGTNDYFSVKSYPSINKSMTMSMWVKADSLPQWATLAKIWAGGGNLKYHFGLYDFSGDISIFTYGGGVQAGPVREGSALPTGSWQHVAFSAGRGFIRLYRNGKEVGTAVSYNGQLGPGDDYIGFGVKVKNDGTPDTANTPAWWNGGLSDIRIFNRALYPLEIDSLYRDQWAAGRLKSQPITVSSGGSDALPIIHQQQFMV